ncbi:MAG: hypothetical protein FJW95_08245 [Actinobacteria bacterium]|nr:hypothetical protein [Actinomycetota bacterium]
MNTTVMIDRVHDQARELRPLRVLLTILAAPFFVLGFLVRAVFAIVWVALTWCWAATVVGWQAGKRNEDR